MRAKTRSGQLGEWQRLLAALQVNQTELAFLDTQRTQLETMVDQAEDYFQSQAALAASKQDASQKLAALVAECQRMQGWEAGIEGLDDRRIGGRGRPLLQSRGGSGRGLL